MSSTWPKFAHYIPSPSNAERQKRSECQGFVGQCSNSDNSRFEYLDSCPCSKKRYPYIAWHSCRATNHGSVVNILPGHSAALELKL